MLLGDPGSGKSTFVNHLTQALATRDWGNLPGWPERERNALPIPVILRDFARWLAARQPLPAACPESLWDFMVNDLTQRRLGSAAKPLEQALENGRAVVLLDGLDEVPPHKEELLACVRNSVVAFEERYRNSRQLVTCRVLSYQEPRWQLPETEFPALELAPFSEEKIDRFIGAWYAEVGDKWGLPSGDGERLAEKLRQAVRRPDLWRLAPNPLLLTVMALVHTHRKELPEKRALLYQDAVDILLQHWEKHKEVDAPQLKDRLDEVGRDMNDLKGVLERLAFTAHAQGEASGTEEEGTGIDELTLIKEFAVWHPKKDYGWAQRLLETLRLRASLLLERRGQVFSFPHRTFQEYLAGVHLAHQPNFAETAARLAGEAAFWREVILLAVGYLVHHQRETEKPRWLVEQLCPERAPATDDEWRKVWLAGEVLLEMGVNRVRDTEHGQRLLARVCRFLAALLEDAKLNARERAEAGDVLGQLGDPRFAAELCYLPCTCRGEPEPLAGFVKIPAGPFVMGEDNKTQNLSIDYSYWIARYPVTVAQFGAFVEVGGDAPRYWNKQKEFPNRPVMGLSWFEAVTYCRWLDETLRHTGKLTLLNEQYVVRLPTEAEWEKAARNADDRPYLWGQEDWTEERANIYGSDISHATPVGMYPGGATPRGLHEISGNVFEWTLSLYRNYPYNPKDGRNDPNGEGSRVLRGGSWNNYLGDARCASRLRNRPAYFDGVCGFRVVLSLANSVF